MKKSTAREYRWLFLGVEISVRELESRLLMAYEALDRGYAVVLGRTNAVAARAALLPHGVYIHKSIGVANAPKLFSAFRKAGSRSMAFDEEALLIDDKESFIRYQTSAESLNEVDLVLCWGAYHREVLLEAYPQSAEKLISVGHPRVDLLREEFFPLYRTQVSEYRARFGQFILVNTNFAVGDHAHFGEEEMIAAWYKRGKLTSPEDELQQRRRIAFKRRMSDAFYNLTALLCERYPQTNIVVRPHPSENRAKWESQATRHANLHVVFEGSVHSWLLAATATIQNNCTTGLEGRLLGRSVVSYRPFVDEEWDSYLINAITEQASTPEQIYAYLDSALARGPEGFEPFRGAAYEVGKHHIENLDGEFAAHRILDLVDRLELRPSALNSGAIRRGALQERIRSAMYRVAEKRQGVAKVLLGNRRAGRWRRKAIKSTRKFDSVPVEFVKEYLGQLDAVRAQNLHYEITLLRNSIAVLFPTNSSDRQSQS